MTDARLIHEFFSQIPGQGQGPVGPKIVKYGYTPDRYAPIGSKISNGAFQNMSLQDFSQSETKPKFLISSWGLGHRYLNLGYLAKSAKCLFSDMDRAMLMKLGMWVEVDQSSTIL